MCTTRRRVSPRKRRSWPCPNSKTTSVADSSVRILTSTWIAAVAAGRVKAPRSKTARAASTMTRARTSTDSTRSTQKTATTIPPTSTRRRRESIKSSGNTQMRNKVVGVRAPRRYSVPFAPVATAKILARTCTWIERTN